MAFFNETLTASPSLSQRISAFRAAYKEHRARRKLQAQTLNELRSLSDRDLADLGMVRSNIRAIAREAAYGTD